MLYLDGKTKEHTGVTKDGADFDYKGRYSDSVLIASLEGAGFEKRLKKGRTADASGHASARSST